MRSKYTTFAGMMCVDVVYSTSVVGASCSTGLSNGLVGAGLLGGAGMSSLPLDGATYREENLTDISFRLSNRRIGVKLV